MDVSLQEPYLEELKNFLRIPSVSTDPRHKADVWRAAEFVAAQLRAAGMRNVGLIEKAGASSAGLWGLAGCDRPANASVVRPLRRPASRSS